MLSCCWGPNRLPSLRFLFERAISALSCFINWQVLKQQWSRNKVVRIYVEPALNSLVECNYWKMPLSKLLKKKPYCKRLGTQLWNKIIMPGNIAKELFNFVNSPKHSKLLTFEECELLCTIKKNLFNITVPMIWYCHLTPICLVLFSALTVLVNALILTSGGKGQVIHHRLFFDFSHSLSVSLEVSDPFSSSSEKSQ